jgi:hypothetical protein
LLPARLPHRLRPRSTIPWRWMMLGMHERQNLRDED